VELLKAITDSRYRSETLSDILRDSRREPMLDRFVPSGYVRFFPAVAANQGL